MHRTVPTKAVTALLTILPTPILRVIKVTWVDIALRHLADSSVSGHDCGTVPLPSVLSFSYSSSEAYYTTPYLTRMCNEFAKVRLVFPLFPSAPDLAVVARSYGGFRPVVHWRQRCRCGRILPKLHLGLRNRCRLPYIQPFLPGYLPVCDKRRRNSNKHIFGTMMPAGSLFNDRL